MAESTIISREAGPQNFAGHYKFLILNPYNINKFKTTALEIALPKMPQSVENRRKYRKISYETRKKLIDMVLAKGVKVSKAASILKIRHSTARSIVIAYKVTGNIFETKKDKMKRVLLEELTKKIVEPPKPKGL